jgi:hypothetical protein
VKKKRKSSVWVRIVKAQDECFKYGRCDDCSKKLFRSSSHAAIIDGTNVSGICLCLKCLKHLREQIDAFRVLVLTGEDTK